MWPHARTIRGFLAIAGVVMGLGAVVPAAQAQEYQVNGRAASKAEAQLLASYRMPAGEWVVDGFGITAGRSGPAVQPAKADNKCWYVLDVLLCD